MFPNAKGSELLSVLATIDPAAQAAGTLTTGWISVANHHGFLSLVQTGVLGTSATVDAKLQQALDNSGTSAKDITGKAITQIVKATGDNKQALINVKPEELDTVNGFGFVRLSVTVGVAASQTSAQVLGLNPRFAPADASNQAAVVQVISMPIQLVTPPTEEPVSLLEAKLHLRVDFDEDDMLIASLITAARQAAETLTGRQLTTARWRQVLDCFPGPSLMGVPAGQTFTLPGHAILLAKAPVQSVVSINYLDMGSVNQTMPALTYTVDAACEPARITPVFGQIWPVCLPQIGAVSVTFDAGYGTASQVPEGIKSWIKLRVGSLYAHREEVAALSRGRIEPLPFIDGLLDPYKVVTV
jgi:uncharacterized phiE125 gp8 family phage protein